MIFEANAYIGQWPFRPLPHASADGLLRLMDRKGIDKAVVSSSSAIFYRNAHEGNLELFAAVKGHADRLVPFATINPTYTRWKDDLAECVEKLGMKGLRLHPYYHGYTPADGVFAELAAEAVRHGVPLSISVAMEDQRQRHWLVELPHVDRSVVVNDHVLQAMGQTPAATFILLTVGYSGFSGYEVKRLLAEAPKDVLDGGRLWFAVSAAVYPPVAERLDLLASVAGQRFVFGSQIPFKYPEPAMLMVNALPIDEQGKERVRSGNLLGILGVKHDG